MRSTQHKNRSYKKLIITCSVVVILLIAALVYFIPLKGSLFGWQPNKSNNETTEREVNDVNLDKPTENELQTGEDIKNNSINNPGPQDNSQNTPQATVTVTAANVSNNTVQIRALIDGVINDAACEIIFSQGSATKTYAASTQALSSTSTCQGFDIPSSDLGAGTWAFTISVKRGATVLGSTSGEVSI